MKTPSNEHSALSPSVIVVDDTEGNRYAVSRLLRGAGMRVREADSGTRALELLAEAVPDLVVLDINLPDLSGHEVLQRIKAATATASVPVMHVSASYVTNADRAYGLEHGADAYLTHPLDPEVFVATARALLRSGRADSVRARRYDDALRARRAAEAAAMRATLLQDLTAALARTMTPAEVSQVVLGRAFTALDATAAMLVATTPSGRLERIGSAARADEPEHESPGIGKAASALLEEAVRTRAAVSRELPGADGSDGARASSLHAAPLIVDRGADERVLGAMLFAWDHPGAAGPAEVALITTVADQCAQALERARLYAAERRARATAEEASRAKSQLLSMLSHELRTPLNSIRGHIDLVDAGVHGPLTPEQRDALGRAQRSARYLTGLIDDLLNFSRIDTGHVTYAIGAVPLTGPRGVLSDVEALVATQAAAKGVTVVRAASPACAEGVRARADAEKVRIILVNLVTNAIKFTDAGGTISLACAPGADDTVELSVTDSGRGIETSQLERIFEAFVQLDRQHTPTSQQGVGLGLAIARTLARGMGGELSVVSALGRGSTFTLRLPLA